MSGRWILLAAGLLVAACSLEPARPETGAKMTIVADIDGTKVAFDNYKLSWEPTDRIALASEGYGITNEYTYSREREDGKVVFEGDPLGLPAPYIAAWPYDYVQESEGDGFRVYFYNRQTVPAGGVSSDHMFLFATGEDELHFSPAVGLLKFTVKDPAVTQVEIATISDAPLAVNSVYNNGGWIDSDTGRLRILYGESDHVTVYPEEGKFVTGKPYYVAVPPGSYESGITVTLVNDENKEAFKHSYNTLQVEAGKVTNLGELDAEFDAPGLPDYVECSSPILFRHYGFSDPYGLPLDSTFDLGSCVYAGPSSADQGVGFLSLDERLKVTDDGIVSATEPVIGVVKVYSLVKPSCYRMVCFHFGGFAKDGVYYSINPDLQSAFVTNSSFSSDTVEDSYSGTVVIPASVTYNGVEYLVLGVMERAFWKCKNLVKVVLPEGLESIDVYSFNGCTSLEELNLPSTLKYMTNISTNSFVLNCPKLSITSKAERFPVDEYGNLYDDGWNKELIWLCEKTAGTNVIREGISGIGSGDGPLYNSFATAISFPASLKYDIWVNCFSGDFPNIEEIIVEFDTYEKFEAVFKYLRKDSGERVAGQFSRLKNRNSETPSAVRLSVPAAYASEYSTAVADYGFSALVTH